MLLFLKSPSPLRHVSLVPNCTQCRTGDIPEDTPAPGPCSPGSLPSSSSQQKSLKPCRGLWAGSLLELSSGDRYKKKELKANRFANTPLVEQGKELVSWKKCHQHWKLQRFPCSGHSCAMVQLPGCARGRLSSTKGEKNIYPETRKATSLPPFLLLSPPAVSSRGVFGEK